MTETTLRQDLEAIASGMTGDRTPAGIAAIALEKLAELEKENALLHIIHEIMMSCICIGT